MAWLFLILAVAALAVAFKTTSVALLVTCLLLAFALILAFVLKLLSERVDSRSGNEAMMLDPDELRRLREQAEARKLAASPQQDPQR